MYEGQTWMGTNLGTQHLHVEHVELLSAHVFCTHVNNTFEAELRTSCRSSHAVLTSPSLSNYTLFPDPFG